MWEGIRTLSLIFFCARTTISAESVAVEIALAGGVNGLSKHCRYHNTAPIKSTEKRGATQTGKAKEEEEEDGGGRGSGSFGGWRSIVGRRLLIEVPTIVRLRCLEPDNGAMLANTIFSQIDLRREAEVWGEGREAPTEGEDRRGNGLQLETEGVAASSLDHIWI